MHFILVQKCTRQVLSETKKCQVERSEENIKSDITGPFLSLYAPVTLIFNNIKVTPMRVGYTENDEKLLRSSLKTTNTDCVQQL